MSDDILRFRVDIPESDVADLRRRLHAARFPEPFGEDDWSKGVPVEVLRRLAATWIDFDWSSYQDRLNQVPQFVTEIDGQRIHFVRVRSKEPDAVPLLLTHGWPGSFLEFLALIGPLTDPVTYGGDAADAFDVVIPSIPGFGFSTPLISDRWPTRRIAEAWVTLMDRLGYGRYAVQGGDLGAAISPEVARIASDRVIGVHVNGTLGFGADVDDETAATLTDLEKDRLRRTREFMQNEFGYITIQSNPPTTRR